MKHILASCLFIALCAPAVAQPSPEQKPAAAPAPAATPAAPVVLTCVYNSKTYSGGAQVCVNKNLMLTCAADSTKAVWNVATDKDAHDKCARPVVHLTKAQRRARWQRYNIGRQITRPTGSPPFCFGIDDGPLYCE
jgi:Protein of unknown function (DUF1496)